MKARREPQDGSDAGDRLIGSAPAPDRFAPGWLEVGFRRALTGVRGEGG
jgi:hypothetical protein